MKKSLNKKALLLSYFTIIYNIIEGAISVFFGAMAGSIALVGFGLDSFVESLSGGIIVWRFWERGLDEHEEEKIEQKAIKLVSYTFFVLAAYVFYESTTKLYLNEIPEPTVVGIVITIISLIIMPILYYKKHSLGHKIKSNSLIADAKQTLACMGLSVAVLSGITLNKLFGFWQADPIAGIIVGIFLVREGWLTLKEKEFCAC